MHRPLPFTLGTLLCIAAVALGVYLARDQTSGMSYEEMADRLPLVVVEMSERANRIAYGAPVVLLMLGVGMAGIVLGFTRPRQQQIVG